MMWPTLRAPGPADPRHPLHPLRAALAALVAVVAATAVAPAASAETPDQRIVRALDNRVTTTRFGTAFSGTVLDAASNQVIWTRNGSTGRMPASTTKLVTAHNALMTFGPTKQWTTKVRQGAYPNRVIVEGAGDPSLSSRQLDAMAQTVAATMRSRGITQVRVYVDDRIFPVPTPAYGWLSSYMPYDITPVRGLVRDQRDLSDTSADVGTYFRDRLRAHGVRAWYWGRGWVRSGAATLASSKGWRLSAIIKKMLLTSDNEMAEAVHKLVSLAKRGAPDWATARSAQREVMNANGLPLTTLYDGSGLSRADSLTTLDLVTLIDRGSDRSYGALWPLRSAQAIPTAGRTGTLQAKYGRFTTYQSQCAAGQVWAKTGTLNDAVALAGYTYGKDGRLKVFAFLVNGRSSTLTLKQSLDMLAATVNGCY